MADNSELKPSKSNLSKLSANMHSDINMVIMDYLISEGYPGAAEKFAQETNLFESESIDVDSIKQRVKIRNAIYQGQLEEAIERINDLDAEILDQNKSLHFRLLQLQLIEMIRLVLDKGDPLPDVALFRPALTFATQQLAPHAPTDRKHLDALEKTMALMIFRRDKMLPEMKDLLDYSLRETVAAEVNKALLLAKGREPEARIKELVRARAWAEIQARDAQVTLPADLSIGLVVESSGGEPMVT